MQTHEVPHEEVPPFVEEFLQLRGLGNKMGALCKEELVWQKLVLPDLRKHDDLQV